MKSIKVILSIVLVAVLALPNIVSAKDTVKVGKITAASGKSQVKKSGGEKKFTAFKGMALTQGDTVITGKDGKVNMDLDSDKEVIIGPGTTLIISQLVQSAKAAEGKTSLSLAGGKVMIKIKKKLKGESRFEVKTPTAIMGVMGTEFIVGYEASRTYVGVLEGKVSVAKGNRIITHIVSPQEQLILTPDGRGQVGKLVLADLPLFALERYDEELTSQPGVDSALKQQVKKEIELKRAQAAKDTMTPVAGMKKNAIFEESAPSIFPGSGQTGGGSTNPGNPSVPGTPPTPGPGQPPGDPNGGTNTGGTPGGGNNGGGNDPTPPVVIPAPTLAEQPEKYSWDKDLIEDAEIKIDLLGNKLQEIVDNTAANDKKLVKDTDYTLTETSNGSDRQLAVTISKDYLKQAGKSIKFQFKFDHNHDLTVTLNALNAPVPGIDTVDYNNNTGHYIPDRQTVIIPYTEPIAFVSADTNVQKHSIDFNGNVQSLEIKNDTHLIIHLNSKLGFNEEKTLTIKGNTIKHVKADTVQDQDQSVSVKFSNTPHVGSNALAIPTAADIDQTFNLDVYNYGLDLGELRVKDAANTLNMPLSEGYDYEVNMATANHVSIKFSSYFTSLLNSRISRKFTLTIPLKNNDGSMSDYQFQVELNKP